MKLSGRPTSGEYSAGLRRDGITILWTVFGDAVAKLLARA